MRVKNLIIKLLDCNPDADVKCVTYENKDVDAKEFALNIRTLEDYGDYIDIVLDDLDIGKIDDNGAFENLKKEVLDWAKDKDLIHRKNSEKQFLKFMEEVFEFKSEYDLVERTEHDKLREIYEERMKLEMGDIFVTLIILCRQLDIEPFSCLEKAYNKISVRTGKTINGTFVKKEDLEGWL